MRRLWITADLDGSAEEAWELLVDPGQWPRWGPSVIAARVDGGVLAPGATGQVTTAVFVCPGSSTNGGRVGVKR